MPNVKMRFYLSSSLHLRAEFIRGRNGTKIYIKAHYKIHKNTPLWFHEIFSDFSLLLKTNKKSREIIVVKILVNKISRRLRSHCVGTGCNLSGSVGSMYYVIEVLMNVRAHLITIFICLRLAKLVKTFCKQPVGQKEKWLLEKRHSNAFFLYVMRLKWHFNSRNHNRVKSFIESYVNV